MKSYVDSENAARLFDDAADMPPHLRPAEAELDTMLDAAQAAYRRFCRDVPGSAADAALKVREAAKAIEAGTFEDAEYLSTEAAAIADTLDSGRAPPNIAARLRCLLAGCEYAVFAHRCNHGYSDGHDALELLQTTLAGLTKPRVVN